MRKIHDVLRLHLGLKLPQRQIARSVQLSQSTVSEYLTRFQKAGLPWPLPEGYDDQRLQQELFGPDNSDSATCRPNAVVTPEKDLVLERGPRDDD